MHLPLYWKSHCATCSPVYVILYHVTGSCKGPIVVTECCEIVFIYSRWAASFSHEEQLRPGWTVDNLEMN